MTNKILIASIWAASVALAYWLGLEGGSEFAASNEMGNGSGGIARGPLPNVKGASKSPPTIGSDFGTINSPLIVTF